VKKLSALIEPCAANPGTLTDSGPIQVGFEDLTAAHDLFAAALKEYDPLEKAVSAALKAVVDAESKTGGWQELIDLARDQANLRIALIDQSAREQLAKEIKQALKQIDTGNEKVLDKKFEELSDGVQAWWDLLRPHDPSFFSGVMPRPNARRTIDFKAGLSLTSDRSNPKVRDVIAVFSQSQLHCLGLSLFLARTAKEGVGFIVLDDPILSSDEDYRKYFNVRVIEKLADAGIQTVVITQHKDTWRDIIDLHKHRSAEAYQIKLTDPRVGTVVGKSEDEFTAMLSQAEPFTLHEDPEIRKIGGQRLREAAERFCKLLLVKKRQDSGDTAATISDYKGKVLGDLEPQVTPYLQLKDPSHPGKLAALRRDLNPANHDDDIPTRAALRISLGTLKDFRKAYLA
jgi:hypothetical protein